MASNPIFLSCLTSPVANGDLLFSLETFDAVPNIAVTLLVTGVLSSFDEEDLATAINTQFTSQLLPYAYNGNPVYSSDNFVAQFRVSQSQHITSIWAQCGYELRLLNDTTGSTIKIATRPALMTICRAKSFANIKGFEFTGADGEPLNDSSIGDLILKSSTTACTFLRSNIAVTTYLNFFRGQDNKSVFLKPTPGIQRDPVLVRRKAYINLYTNPTYLNFSFTYNRRTGELSYRPSSVVVETKSPFGLDNEVQCTLTAGFYVIPEELFWAVTDLNELNLLGLYNIKSLSGGTGSIEFQDVSSLYSRIFAPIKHLKS